MYCIILLIISGAASMQTAVPFYQYGRFISNDNDKD